MLVSGSSCAGGRSHCSRMFLTAQLPEASAPSAPQVELFFPAACMCLDGGKGEKEQFVLTWPLWPGTSCTSEMWALPGGLMRES